jgi:excisionase family DNA binding protein
VNEQLTIDPSQQSEDEWLAVMKSYVLRARENGEVVSLRSRAQFLSPEAAGRRLGMSRSTVTRKIEAGEIKAIKVGKHHRIPLREFEAYRDKVVGSMIAAASDDIEADLNEA